MNIMDYITDKPITRRELVSLTGMTDRLVREAIEKARRDGNIIINLQDGKGYFTSKDPSVLKRQYEINQSRAMSVLVQQKYLRQEMKGADHEKQSQ